MHGQAGDRGGISTSISTARDTRNTLIAWSSRVSIAGGKSSAICQSSIDNRDATNALKPYLILNMLENSDESCYEVTIGKSVAHYTAFSHASPDEILTEGQYFTRPNVVSTSNAPGSPQMRPPH